MPINPNISLAVKPIELQDPMAQYAKLMAIQNAQQQNQLARIQMEQSQSDRASTNALNQAYAAAYNPQTGDIDLNKLRQSVATGGYGSKLPALDESIYKARKARTEADKATVDVEASRLKLASDAEAMYRNVVGQIGSKADAVVFLQKMINDPALKGSPITAIPLAQQVQRIPEDPAGLNEWVKNFALGTTKWVTENKPQLSTKDTGSVLIDRTFEPMTGKVTELSRTAKTMAPGEAQRLANDAVRIRQEGQRIGLEGRRVAVLEENNRRDSDPTFQQRMAAARATGEAAAKGDVAAQQALSKGLSRAEQGMRLIDELVGKRDSKTGKLIEGSKPHPGFTESVGATWMPGARFIPGSDAAGFMSRFDQIKGASFLEAFESLKGGGAITQIEGQKATDAINRMSTSTSEAEFVRAALDLQNLIRKGVENAQRRASRGGGVGGAPAASGNVIDFGSLK